MRGAHRISFWIWHGRPVAKGLVVRHLCHQRECVNPCHLMEGTTAENNADTVQAGRQARGESSGMAKLTERQVVDIRARYTSGEVTMMDLSRHYDVDPALISGIVRGKSWIHVTGGSDLTHGRQHWARQHPERTNKGEGHGCARLTECQVLEIIELVQLGTLTQSQIGVRFGVTKAAIQSIASGVTWTHLPRPGNFTPRKCLHRKLSDMDLAKIRELGATGQYLQREIAALYGVGPDHISRILSGVRCRGG